MSDSAAKATEKKHDKALFNKIVEKHFKKDVESEEELEKAVKILKNLKLNILVDEAVGDIELSKMNEAQLHDFMQRAVERYLKYAVSRS